MELNGTNLLFIIVGIVIGMHMLKTVMRSFMRYPTFMYRRMPVPKLRHGGPRDSCIDRECYFADRYRDAQF